MVTGDKSALVADTSLADLTFFGNGLVPKEWSDVARLREVTEGKMTRFSFPKPVANAIVEAAETGRVVMIGPTEVDA